MRVSERDTAAGEPVDVRRLHLRVAAQRADPVVQIVDRNEKNIGRLRAGLRSDGATDRIQDKSGNQAEEV